MNKYKNKKCSTIFHGDKYKFDSKAEMDYFEKLGERLEDKEIETLTLQPRYYISDGFTIATNKTKSGKSRIGAMVYTPDFSYIENGKLIVVEVKGKITTDYRMRLKLFLAHGYTLYGVNTFIEVIKGKETFYECSSVQSVTTKKKKD